jgi:hypothetical protein
MKIKHIYISATDCFEILCAVNVGQGITIKGTEIGVGILGVWGIQM